MMTDQPKPKPKPWKPYRVIRTKEAIPYPRADEEWITVSEHYSLSAACKRIRRDTPPKLSAWRYHFRIVRVKGKMWTVYDYAWDQIVGRRHQNSNIWFEADDTTINSKPV